jgi:hypothetical protein
MLWMSIKLVNLSIVICTTMIPNLKKNFAAKQDEPSLHAGPKPFRPPPNFTKDFLCYPVIFKAQRVGPLHAGA